MAYKGPWVIRTVPPQQVGSPGTLLEGPQHPVYGFPRDGHCPVLRKQSKLLNNCWFLQGQRKDPILPLPSHRS